MSMHFTKDQVELFKCLLCGCHFDSRVNVCAGLVHFEAQNFCFLFVPVQVWCTLRFKTCVFLVPVPSACLIDAL